MTALLVVIVLLLILIVSGLAFLLAMLNSFIQEEVWWHIREDRRNAGL